jgi:hypothetical protein
VVGVIALIIGGGVLAINQWLTAGFPPLDTATAKTGEWYSVYPDGAIDAAGDPYHANIRMGSENKVMVVFNGGGVSVDDYTEARPVTSITTQGLYTVIKGLDQQAKTGLAEDVDGNPFRNWTVIQLPYSTGDFHAGGGENTVSGLEGKPQTVHHNGFTNLQLVLEDLGVKKVTGSPTDLLVAGGSAGGFGAAIATDEVMSHFPDTTNVTTMVDSALLLYDWHTVSTDVWKSPAAISDVLTSEDFTLDALTALKAKHPTVTILFASSIRDESLARMQSYLSGGKFEATKEGGVQYLTDLTAMVAKLQTQVPDIGLYIFQGSTNASSGLTQHTIGNNTRDKLSGDTSPLEWVEDAVGGDVASYGLELLADADADTDTDEDDTTGTSSK